MKEMLRYRWTSFGPMLDEDGPFVTYADHVEALRQATALATPETVAQANYWYEQGQMDAIAAAVQRVEVLIDPWPNTSPGVIRRGNVFAAIKGDQP
jgi:hypothetical protein